MPIVRDSKKLDRMLGNAGLATMQEPEQLLGQLAFAIRSHSQFRRMLVTVEPEQRQQAYNAMRGRVPFKPKPLDVYLAEAGQDAERQKLCVKDDEAMGGFREFTPARNAETLKVVEESIALKFGVMTCYKCTQEQDFFEPTPVQSRVAAVRAGWVFDPNREPDGGWICPKCPAVRPTN